MDVGEAFDLGILGGSPLDAAPALLGATLVHAQCRGRIVEVEAYLGATDAASHAFRGRTTRNEAMFGPAGTLYVYFTYGMHHCANVVCGSVDDPGAVLIRAVEPVAGLELMRDRRPKAGSDRGLCSGPAKLCQAFGIDLSHDGSSLASGPVQLRRPVEGARPPEVVTSPRIGISKATEERWRWFDPASAHLSRPVRDSDR